MTRNIDRLSVGQAAKFLRVSTRTLQRWDRSGRLPAARNDQDRREYTREQLAEFAQRHHIDYRPDRTTYYPAEEAVTYKVD